MQSARIRFYSSPELLNQTTIVWLQGDGNYTRIHRLDHAPLVVSYTLKRFEEHLTGFVRVRRDVVVNPAFVKTCWKSGPEPFTLCLIDGTVIKAPRRKWRSVMQQLEKANVKLNFLTD